MKRCGEALSVMILCLSAVLAWRLGFSLGASDVEKHILALVSVALEGWKVLLPFVILSAWRQRRVLALTLSIIVWPLLTAYSFIGGLGFAELNRGALAGTRGAAVERVTTLKSTISDLTLRRAGINTQRSVAELLIAITAVEHLPVRAGTDTKTLIVATDTCTRIVTKKAVDACAELTTLKREHAQATDRDRIDVLLATARGELQSASGLDWQGIADPQITALAALSGFDAPTTRQIVNVGFAALLELVGGFGLFFASLLERPRAAVSAPDAPIAAAATAVAASPVETDEARVARYLAVRTVVTPSATIIASKLHADFSRWAHALHTEPISLTTFGNLIAKHGIAKQKVDGLMHYQNIAFVIDTNATREAA